jgi:hypothetical protein
MQQLNSKPMQGLKLALSVFIVGFCFSLQSCEKPECDENNEGDIDVYNHMNEDLEMQFDDVVIDTIFANGQRNYTRLQGLWKLRAVGLTSGQTVVYNIEVEECQTRQVDILW